MNPAEVTDIDVLIKEIELLKKRNSELLNYEAERLEIEKALRESELKYKDLFDNAPIGYHELSNKGVIIRINKTELGMLGFTEEEMLGRYIWDFISSVETDKAKASFDAKITGLTKLEKGFERSYRRKDGSDIFVFIYDRLIRNSDGEIIGISSTIQDITEKREAEEKLRQYAEELHESNAAKDKFFSIIAHDLKSPFMGLLGLTGILVEDFDTMALGEIKKFAGDIAVSSKKIYQFLENLLTWARLHVGKMYFSPKEVNFSGFCQCVNDLISGNALNKKIELSYSIPARVTVFIDENMICSVLENLISNALKFTPVGGKVTISAREKGNLLEVAVADSGVGIRKEDMDKLFRIDVQHSTKGTMNEKGTGLGLLLCKEMIEKHSGTIWVESQWSQGSTFYFTLPLAVPAA